MTYPTYFEALDHQQLLTDYPIGDNFTERYAAMSKDELFAIQNAQFKRLMMRGWQVPFYQRLWGARGIEPGDIGGLEDITKLPVYDKSDLMASIADYPPYGDFHGMGDASTRPPTIFHTTSGTTGKPQTLMFGPKGREVGNLLVGRMYRWMGLGSEDVVHSVYGHGMINGGHYIREAVTHFTNSVFLSAGTGIETRSINQVRLMADFGVTAIVGFVDYVRKLAGTAEAEELFDKINIRMIIGHLGTEDRASTEAAWHGAKAYDWYGVGDTGTIAGEGPERDGMYVWEDAQYLELLDIDSGAPVAHGETGDMVVTCLYKDDIAPCIRFNTHDITHELDGRGEIVFKRIAGFKGRSDNMVKLRGINVFPHAIGAIIENRSDLTGEYVCHLRRDEAQKDHMTVTLESHGGTDLGALSETLKQGLGVEVEVVLVGPGGTAKETEIDTRQKPLRLVDQRACETLMLDSLNAFLYRDDNATGGSGALAGLSVGVKANIAVKGMPFHAGIGAWEDRRADADAEVVARLRAEGAIITGILNMEEGALGAKTDNPHFGATQNPHRHGYSPGGSSGGSGAAVAAGLCDVALGTDTMGSVRIPTAHCGIYGFKPATDAVSQDGLIPAEPSLDAIGPLARDLDTLERVTRVMSDFGEGDIAGSGATLIDHGVEVDEPVAKVFVAALAALEAVPKQEALSESNSRIRFAGFIKTSYTMAADLEGVEGLSPHLRKLLTYGPARDAKKRAMDMDVLNQMLIEVRGIVKANGFLILPTVPNPPFLHSDPEPAAQADFTCLANIAGLPAISIPAGWTDDLLPIGVQIIGSVGAEAGLFRLARQLDTKLGAYRAPQTNGGA